MRRMNSSLRPLPRTVWTCLLMLACMVGYHARAHAAEVSVSVSLSEDAAYMIREWRRAHGLPQAPESAGEARATAKRLAMSDRGTATQKALHLMGFDGVQPEDLQVSARHDGSYWQVSIKLLSDTSGSVHVVEVADSIAASGRPHAP